LVAAGLLTSRQIQKSLTEQNVDAVFVKDGNDALRLLQSRNWSAVLLESDIAEIGGVVFVQQFRLWSKESDVPQQNICISSAGHRSENEEESGSVACVQLPTGVDDALGKPSSTSEMMETLHVSKVLQYENQAQNICTSDIVTMHFFVFSFLIMLFIRRKIEFGLSKNKQN
jgi:DNA-binding response OmpR family regulator